MDQFVHVEFNRTTGHLSYLFEEESPGCVSKEVLVLVPIMAALPQSRGWRRYWKSWAGGLSARSSGVADLPNWFGQLAKAMSLHWVNGDTTAAINGAKAGRLHHGRDFYGFESDTDWISNHSHREDIRNSSINVILIASVFIRAKNWNIFARLLKITLTVNDLISKESSSMLVKKKMSASLSVTTLTKIDRFSNSQRFRELEWSQSTL